MASIHFPHLWHCMEAEAVSCPQRGHLMGIKGTCPSGKLLLGMSNFSPPEEQLGLAHMNGTGTVAVGRG